MAASGSMEGNPWAPFDDHEAEHSKIVDGMAWEPSRPVSPPPQSSDSPHSVAISIFHSLRDDPTEFKQQIDNYAPLVDGTHLPNAFRDFDGACDGKFPTFLSLLIDCDVAWLSSLRNVQDRPSKVKATLADVDWLLQFTIDYIRLSHSSFRREDTTALVKSIRRLSGEAMRQIELNYCIRILHALSEKARFSLEDVERSLLLLAGAANLPLEDPDPLEASLGYFVFGKLGDMSLKHLWNSAARPNKTKSESYVPKAHLRLLAIAADHDDSPGSYRIDLGELALTLYEASEQREHMISEDVLFSVERLLRNQSRQDEILSQHLGTLCACVLECMKTPSSKEQELQKIRKPGVEPRSRDMYVRLMDQHLERVWHRIDVNGHIKITDYFLQHPKSHKDEFMRLCFQTVLDNKLCLPSSTGWSERCNWLENEFVRGDQVPTVIRVQAINLLKDMTCSILREDKDGRALELDQQIGAGPVQRVLNMVTTTYPTEQDLEVHKVLLRTLEAILLSTSLGVEEDQTIQNIIKDLFGYALESAQTAKHAGEAAATIVDIFREFLDTQATYALLAYGYLVKLAGTDCKFIDARLEALRLLVRLRSTSSGLVYVTDDVDSESVATMLCRTTESAKALLPDRVGQPQSSSSTSLSSHKDESEPLWNYDDEIKSVSYSLPPNGAVHVNRNQSEDHQESHKLDIGAWLIQAVTCLQADTQWEIYSFILVHLGSQLTNVKLFRRSLAAITKLRQILHSQIMDQAVHKPPATSGLQVSDVALCIFNILTALIPYAALDDVEIDKSHFGKQLVQAFRTGISTSQYDGAFRSCMHAMTICSLEVPEQVGREYPAILSDLGRFTTKSALAIHMLEFMSHVAMLPEVHRHFNQNDRRSILALCITVLNHQRAAQSKTDQALSHRGPSTTLLAARATGTAKQNTQAKISPYRAQMLEDIGVPLYLSALAYHTMISWFLSTSLRHRSELAQEMTRKLIWLDDNGEPQLDQQGYVYRDMMIRATYTDLGETIPHPDFLKPDGSHNNSNEHNENAPSPAAKELTDGSIETAHWLSGYSIITIETAGHTGLTQIIKRQASGTTYATYKQVAQGPPPHQAPALREIEEKELSVLSLPEHVMLQLQITAAPVAPSEQPIRLPMDDAVMRAIAVFDRNPIIDSHKAGVLFVGPGQTTQSEIMTNTKSSADFKHFSEGLGKKVSLKHPCKLFNPQGLTHPEDGEETIAWCDRVTEIVFLVPELMPLGEDEDPPGTSRYAHVGNSYVNIIFNQSGVKWNLETLKSSFNYVNIVVAPADLEDGAMDDPTSRGDVYYRVQVLTKEGVPNISPAADTKIVSANEVPRLVRVLALSACVYSQAWQNRDQDTEFHSPWRNRLLAIKELRNRYDKPLDTQHKQVRSTVLSSPPASAMGRSRTPVPHAEADTPSNWDMFAAKLDFVGWMRRKGA